MLWSLPEEDLKILLTGLPPVDRVATMRTLSEEDRLQGLACMTASERAATLAAMDANEKEAAIELLSQGERGKWDAVVNDMSATAPPSLPEEQLSVLKDLYEHHAKESRCEHGVDRTCLDTYLTPEV